MLVVVVEFSIDGVMEMEFYAVDFEMLCHISFPPPVVVVCGSLPVTGQP